MGARTEGPILAELLECETAVWEALVAGDMTADAAALDAEFLGVYPDGFAGKTTHVQQLAKGPTVKRYSLDQARVMPLGADHALLSYRARYCRAAHDANETMYVSSVWARSATGWINVFSQDTPAVAI